MARSDVGYTVRTAAVHVWKTVVSNTPRTLGEILPALMEQVINALASAGERPGLWLTTCRASRVNASSHASDSASACSHVNNSLKITRLQQRTSDWLLP